MMMVFMQLCVCFELLINTDKSLDQLLAVFPHKYSSPEYRIPCPDEKKQSVVDYVTMFFSTHPGVHILTLDGVRVTMTYGWGLVRASNTQPMYPYALSLIRKQD